MVARCPAISRSRQLNIVTQSSPTGSQCIPAVGCAEAGPYIWRHRHEDLPGCTAHEDEVVYVSLGEGATSEGEFWESLNTACSLRLPVLYIIADNGYAISVPASQQSPRPDLGTGKELPYLCAPPGWPGLFRGQGQGARDRRALRHGHGPGIGARHGYPAVLALLR